MKNTVYSRARESQAECIEDFGRELAEFFLTRNPQVTQVAINIAGTLWANAPSSQGALHPSTFIRGTGETETTAVTASQDGSIAITSGLDGLLVLKTARSAFEGYIRDSLTTLPETADRLFGTSLRAQWKYQSSSLAFAELRGRLRDNSRGCIRAAR